MAYDDLPQPQSPTNNPPTPPTPPETETRNILDPSTNVIGTLTLLAGTSESTWTSLLAYYANIAVGQTPGFIEIASIVPTNTNSANYVALNGMISASLDAGTYMVNFTGNVGTNAPLLSSPGFSLCLFANGVQIPTSEVSDVSSSLSLFSISPIAMAVNSLVTVATGQKIEVRWKTNGAGNTITCTNRVLDLVRIK